MNPPEAGDTRRIARGDVRSRLARVEEATREAQRLSPERARAVMDERARALARVPARPPSAAEVIEVATFDLGDERYAIPTRFVRRVVRPGEPTPVPGAPDFLTGLVNLRGEILAIFDLRRMFDVATRDLSERSRVVVLGEDRDEFGLLVDAAHGVTTLRIEDILDPPGTAAAPGHQHVRGVTSEALIVLDGAAMLKDPRLIIDQGDE